MQTAAEQTSSNIWDTAPRLIFMRDHPSNLDPTARIVFDNPRTGDTVFSVKGGYVADYGFWQDPATSLPRSRPSCFSGLFASIEEARQALDFHRAASSARPIRLADAEIAKIERNLARLPTDGDRIVHLNHEIERFEDISAAFERWRNRPLGEPPHQPWTDDNALYVRLRIGAMHAALVDKIKAAKVEAIAALPEGGGNP